MSVAQAGQDRGLLTALEWSEATVAARNEGWTSRIHMFTNGCAKQYKGKRSFRFLTDSVRQIGFFIDHRFAATSHFKGCHDGIDGVAKKMRRRERFGERILGADGAVRFLMSFFRERADGGGEEGTRKYFATWPPYRMRKKVHVEFIGKKEICRPDSILEGVGGTMEMHHIAGANTPKYDAQTTTEGLEDDELGREEEPIFIARFGRWAGF